MAFTKLYLTTATAPYTPATIRGAWDDTAGSVTRALDVSPQTGGNITTVARAETDINANFDVLLYRGVSGPIGAQTFGGTVDVVIGVLESNIAADFAWHIHIYVTQGDSDTPRGTLLTDYVETTANEWPTTAAGKALASAQSIAALAVSAGDRIVVEIGYVSLNAVTTSRTGTLWYGTKVDSVAVGDLTAGGDETALAGFISFSASVSEGTIGVRDTQSFVESIVSEDVDIYDTQSFVEVIVDAATAGEVRNTQSFIEVIVESEPPEPEPTAVDDRPYGIIELGLGGSFDQMLRDLSPLRLWRLGDVRTTRARDDMHDFEWDVFPATDGTYVGSPTNGRGMLPTYGLSTTLDGATQYVNIDSGIPGTVGPFAIVALVQPGGSGDRCVIQTGTDAAYLGINGSNHAVFGRNGGTLLESTTAILAGERFVLIGTYDGTDATLYLAPIDNGGTLETVGPTAVTFTAAHDSTQARIGATASGGNLFAGNLQSIATFADAIALADVEALVLATLWTDVSEDVHYPITWDRGIHSDRPDTRWARTGTLNFALDNSERNTTATIGYYSPGHPYCRAGFDRGIPCRVVQVVGDDRSIRFIGTIKTIKIAPGEYLQRDVPIMATDWMDEAAKAGIIGIGVQTDVTADDVLARLIDNMDNRPHAIDLGVGTDTYTVAMHGGIDESSTVQSEGIRLVNSEQGYGYLQADGTFVFEPRTVRQSADGFDHAIDEIRMTDPERSGLALLNRVKATVHPVRVDQTDDTILYTTFGDAGSPAAGTFHAIDHGVPMSIFLPFKDPQQKAQRVSAISIQTPVENVDIFINSHPDGTGVDLINDPTITYTITLGGNGAYLDITNEWGQRVYLGLRILGQGVYDYEPIVVRSEDRDSIRRDGLQELNIDLPYLDNPSTAQGIADYIRLLSIDMPTRVRTLSLKMYGAAIIEQVTTTDISTRLAVEETVSGVDRVLVVNGERVSWKEGDDVDVEYWLVTTLASATGGSGGGGGGTNAWVLGVSRLGEDTRLAA